MKHIARITAQLRKVIHTVDQLEVALITTASLAERAIASGELADSDAAASLRRQAEVIRDLRKEYRATLKALGENY